GHLHPHLSGEGALHVWLFRASVPPAARRQRSSSPAIPERRRRQARGVKRRSLRLLETTRTELNAIATPAIRGLSRPAAASGMAAMLYANAQNRFPLIVRSVRRERRMASAAARRSPRTRVRSLASMATSVPVPMASPRSAWARAAASLTPSPTMATTRPSLWRRLTTSTLSAGKTSATTSAAAIPTSPATALATAAWAPATPPPAGAAVGARPVGAGNQHGSQAEVAKLRNRPSAGRFDSVGHDEHRAGLSVPTHGDRSRPICLGHCLAGFHLAG